MRRLLPNSLLLFLVFFTSLFPQENTSRLLLQRANQYLNRGMYKQALPLFKKLHEQYPERFLYAKNLARCYLNQKQPEEALRVIQSRPDYQNSSKLDIASIKIEAYFQLKQNKNALEEAQKITRFLDAQKMSSALAYHSIANILIRYGQLDEAIRILEHGLQKDPSSTYLYSTLGYLARSRMQFKKATDYFLRMVLAQKNMLNSAISQILSMKLNQEQQNEIRNLLVAYMEKHPDRVEFKRLLIEFDLKYKHLETALNLIRSLPEELRNRYLISLADENAREGQYEVAVNRLMKIIDDTDALQRKTIYSKMLNYLLKEIDATGMVPKESIDSVFNRMMSDQIINSVHKRELQLFYIQKFFPRIGDYDQAIKILKDLEKQSFNPVQKQFVYYNLGYFYRLKNDLKTSTHYFSKIDSNISLIEFNRAKMEIYKNRFYLGEWEHLDSLFKSVLIQFPPTDTIVDHILTFRYYLQFNLSPEQRKSFSRALLKIEQKELSAAQKSFEELYHQLPESFEKAWIGLKSAELAYKINKNDFDLTLLEQLSTLKDYPSIREKALFLLAENLNFIYKKSEKAQKIYLEILDIYPKGRFSDLCRTRLEEMKKNPVP